ncbi:MAG: PLP-dependent transferase [Bacteroidota bacterium]
MNPYLLPVPAGLPLPLNNLHAVSVSLPTMKDVIGYEENNIAVISKMESGYPRFFMNKLVEKLSAFLREKHQISDEFEMLPLMSHHSLDIVKRKFNDSFTFIDENGCIFLLIGKTDTNLQPVKDFVRHAGILLSSRKAEDVLFSLGLIQEKQSEAVHENADAAAVIKGNLWNAYGAGSSENVFLCSSGMNAVYAVFEAIIGLTRNKEKSTILQAGWLYLDTLEIIRKFSSNSMLMTSVTDLSKLEEKIIKDHQAIGAVFTEIPNNPLLECLDLPRLYAICQKYNIPLIADATIGTAYNLNILPFCDVAIESLTKFACGKGDVLMGAIILNPLSWFAGVFEKLLLPNIIDPYSRDQSRLALNIEGYENRVQTVSANTKVIIDYLEKSSAVKEVHSVLHAASHENFLKIRRHPGALPGLISVVFKKQLVFYYDKLNIPKGPSLGTEFSLAMPYVYLAHYDKVKTQAGRDELIQMGLHPELLRISIGIEPVEEIISALKTAGI